MKIRYITPFSTERSKQGYPNIGKAYNEAISELPDDCYVCLRDGDTMFLTSDWGQQIHDIIEANQEYDLIGCMTNRVSVKDQLPMGRFSDVPDIGVHVGIAEMLRYDGETSVFPAKLIAGLCMIFHKSVWTKAGGFPENDITFDRVFCDKVLRKGGNIGIAKGLYVFHLYRWGSAKPQSDIKHLIK